MTSLYEDRARPLHTLDALIKEIIGDQTWKERAACKGYDVEIFYPERGVNPNQAKSICNRCEVRDECMAYATDNEEQHGVWGGLSLRERRKAARKTASTEGPHPHEQP